jgi:large subunit ribosomal protein L19
MKEIETIERAQMRDDIIPFQPGDTVKVEIEIKEASGTGEKRTVRTRTQAFQGLVIRRQGAGARETFTVQEGDVRRAKLYYIRDKVGKAARVKKKKFTS